MGEILPSRDLPDSTGGGIQSPIPPPVRFIGFVVLFNSLLWVFGLFVQIRGWVDMATSYILLFIMWGIGILIALAFAFQSKVAHKKVAVLAASMLWAAALLCLNRIAKPPRVSTNAPTATASMANSSVSPGATTSPNSNTPPKQPPNLSSTNGAKLPSAAEIADEIEKRESGKVKIGVGESVSTQVTRAKPAEAAGRVKVALREMVLDDANIPTTTHIHLENPGDEIRVEATDIYYFMDRKEYSPEKTQTQLEQQLWSQMLLGAWKPAVIPEMTMVTIPLSITDSHHLGPDGRSMSLDAAHQLIQQGRLLYFIGAGRDAKSKELLWQFCFFYDKEYPTNWTLCSAGHN